MFLGFQCLVQAVAETPALEHTPRAHVHDLHLVFGHDVVAITNEEFLLPSMVRSPASGFATHAQGQVEVVEPEAAST